MPACAPWTLSGQEMLQELMISMRRGPLGRKGPPKGLGTREPTCDIQALSLPSASLTLLVQILLVSRGETGGEVFTEGTV